MLWCVITCAVCCGGLGVAFLTASPPRLRLPRLSPKHLLRGCLASTLFLIAGLFAALAFSLAR